MLGRALVAAAVLALSAAPAARAGELELRLPTRVIEALAAPTAPAEGPLRLDLARANPWAVRVEAGVDRTGFRVTLTAADGLEVRFRGTRRDAYGLLLGDAQPLDRGVELPDDAWVSAKARDREGWVLMIAREPAAEEPEAGEEPGWLRSLWDGTTLSLRLLGSHRYQVPTLGSLDPDNRVLSLPRQTSEGEVRFDASLQVGRLLLTAKPRLRLTRDHWQDGPRAGDTERDEETVLLEGAARWRFHDTLFVSFGRENLQWGPGQLVNPSNPFFAENGRENPVREISGMDFLRVVWLPSYEWTVSWITNTGRGEGDLQGRDWHPSHALKVEYVGYEANGGLVVHGGPDDKTSFRAFGRWTASDALLLYAEASVQKGTKALYPTDGPPPLGLALDDVRSDDPALLPFTLVGASYTLEAGPTLSLEYVFNGEGYRAGDARRFFDLAHGAAELVAQGLLTPDPGGVPTRLRLLRRHYLFGQYLQSEIADRFTVLVRWTQNLDDRSGLATGYFEWNLSDRWRLFSFAACGSGGNRDEFGSVVRALGLVGVELSAF
ncbi:hypothetical protein [Deferrisoma camini]|uniref:hypothetical protein n=1 Tax=Deferrisoma camini TaxID=1035120 RepID=UPI00046D4DB4|nr:hypothetical protein [Deferrisoma camini]